MLIKGLIKTKRLEKIENTPEPRKSLIKGINAVERFPNTTQNTESQNVLSVSRNKRQVIEAMDAKIDYSKLEKGAPSYDPKMVQLSEAMTSLECGAIQTLPNNILQMLQSQDLKIVN